MKSSALLIFLIIIFWGLWSFFGKIVLPRIGLQVAFWSAFGVFIPIIIYLYVTHQLFPVKLEGTSIFIAIFSGVLSGLASVFFYILLKDKPAGYLTAFTALYPFATIVLSMLFLQESITIPHFIGFLLALAALFFLNL